MGGVCTWDPPFSIKGGREKAGAKAWDMVIPQQLGRGGGIENGKGKLSVGLGPPHALTLKKKQTG